jgi:N-acetylmuramoyl-L-alanine amidase
MLHFTQKITLGLMALFSIAIVGVALRNGEAAPAVDTAVAQAAPFVHTAGGVTHIDMRSEAPAAESIPTAAPVAAAQPIRIGIISGHYQNDPGTVCPDGIREADVNLGVAEHVIARLQRKGYTVDLLGEFDPRLTGYQGDVVLSMHSDSCEAVGLSGFKIARSEDTGIADTDDQLVTCLTNSYAKSSGLSFQEDTITADMRDYHAFREIAPTTPAAIIELGFMSSDRDLLLYRQDQLAVGVVNGIQSFLDSRGRTNGDTGR